jgi:hypothetical protein
MKRFINLSLVAIIFLSGCATLVTIDTPYVKDASVEINAQYIGRTPVMKSLSDAFWDDYVVTIKKDGFYTRTARLAKEFKWAAFAAGFFLYVPWLYVWGPQPLQIFELDKQEAE